MRQGGLPGTALPRGARSVHGDRSFDWNDVDFLLFGVTTEVNPLAAVWGCRAVSHLLPHGDADTFVNGRDANVVRELVIATPQFSCLRARRLVDLHGYLPSLGSCGRKGRRCLLLPAVPPALSPKDVGVFLCSSARACLRRFFPLEIERRFMRRVDHRVRSRGSGCPVRSGCSSSGCHRGKSATRSKNVLNGNTLASL